MEWIILYLGLVIAAILIAWPLLWLRRRVIHSIVSQWTKKNNFELVRYKDAIYSPFTLSLRKSRSQEVVWVEIIDSHGKHRTCWLKLGGYFSGLLNDRAECIWKD